MRGDDGRKHGPVPFRGALRHWRKTPFVRSASESNAAFAGWKAAFMQIPANG
jgi:hypothetical protein